MDAASAAAERHHLPHGLVTWTRDFARWIEPWFVAYAFLAIVQGGLLPVLLPLTSGSGAQAGLVIGAMNLAGLSAPFWGWLADHRRLHRPILLGGLIVVAVALVVIREVPLVARPGVSLLLGFGFAAANTVANMFIVERRPSVEWDARIGALQACAGAGQVFGLLLAGWIGGQEELAFTVAAILVAAGVPIIWRTVRCPDGRVARADVTAHAPLGGEGWTGSPQRHFHHITAAGIGHVLAQLRTPFNLFLLAWLAAFSCTSAALTMFPLAMRYEFGAPPGLAATTYAIAAAISLPLYGPAAGCAHRFGAQSVLSAGLLWRSAALVLLTVSAAAASGQMMASIGFAALVIGWPLLGVAGTSLAAGLATFGKGEAIGLYNAVSALAGAVGAFAGGYAFQHIGYGAICAAGAVTLALVGVVARMVLPSPVAVGHAK